MDTIDVLSFRFSSLHLSQFSKPGKTETKLSDDILNFRHPSSFSLANNIDREKIIRSREILLQHIGEPITIKELSRKVAINECYLKKGFKELFGTTIFDFYQSQRMEHARYLLYEKGLSVTDVSMMLGYSSISHFSTAFKKHTGLKPCELLFH
jgi:AraC-like DNA-binding protein